MIKPVHVGYLAWALGELITLQSCWTGEWKPTNFSFVTWYWTLTIQCKVSNQSSMKMRIHSVCKLSARPQYNKTKAQFWRRQTTELVMWNVHTLCVTVWKLRINNDLVTRVLTSVISRNLASQMGSVVNLCNMSPTENNISFFFPFESFCQETVNVI